MNMILNSKFLKTCFLTLLFSSQLCFAAPTEIAITVDDLPHHGDLPPGVTRLEIVNKMLAAFEKHHIKGVYGLINGAHVATDPDGQAVLERWVASGQLLGNHTYSHLDLGKADAASFITNIQQNDTLLAQLMGNKDFHVFRYPYLAEGNSQQKRDQVRQFLANEHYKIAEVTTDFFDYSWNAPYARCASKHDQAAIDWLKQSFITQSLNAITVSKTLSHTLFGRDIKHILLLHIGALDALMLDDLLTAYEEHGVKFISLHDALRDEVYQINPNVIRDRTYTFLNQIRISRGLPNPPIVTELYQQIPEDKLDKLCR